MTFLEYIQMLHESKRFYGSEFSKRTIADLKEMYNNYINEN